MLYLFRLQHLLDLGFSVREIARDGLLGGVLHYNTIHNFIKREEMRTQRQRYTSLTDAELMPIIQAITRQFPNSGINGIRSMLSQYPEPVNIQRDRLHRLMALVDPVNMARRWAQVTPRRRYSVPTPNSLWHVDTHHKIIK